MRNKVLQKKPSATLKAFCLSALLLFCWWQHASGAQTSFRVICRPELAAAQRRELALELRAITGWRDLDFNKDGALILGETANDGGSQTARKLLEEAVRGRNLIVLEDASNRRDVVFCRVVEGRWTNDAAQKPPVYIMLIDFADFSHVTGDAAARAAFNAGWGVLHETDHVVNDSVDAQRPGSAGPCEALINQMRRECGLAERAEYFFTFLPGTENSAFMTRLVRIAFERQHPATTKRKRYWLIWDAKLVGDLIEQRQLSVRR